MLLQHARSDGWRMWGVEESQDEVPVRLSPRQGWNSMTNAEIDALVAEKVMGWTMGPVQGGVHVAHTWRNYRDANGIICAHTDSFRPTTDWNEAAEVLGKFESYIINDVPMSNPKQYKAALWVKTTGFCSAAVADTGPLAICLAALKAVGVEPG